MSCMTYTCYITRSSNFLVPTRGKLSLGGSPKIDHKNFSVKAYFLFLIDKSELSRCCCFFKRKKKKSGRGKWLAVVQCSPEREAIAVLLPQSQSQSNESILNPATASPSHRHWESDQSIATSLHLSLQFRCPRPSLPQPFSGPDSFITQNSFVTGHVVATLF